MGKRKRRILRNRPGKLGRVVVALDRYRQAHREYPESENMHELVLKTLQA